MTRTTYRLAGCAAALLLALALTGTSATAQELRLQKAVVASAGGTSGNGTYTLRYTIGQSAAGTATDGTTTGTFGFWNESAAVSGVTFAEGAGNVTAAEIAPNPIVGDRGTLRLTISGPGQIEVLLYDALGRQVRDVYSGNRGAGTLELEFDASALNSGSYYMAIRVPGGLIQKPFSIVR